MLASTRTFSAYVGDNLSWLRAVACRTGTGARNFLETIVYKTNFSAYFGLIFLVLNNYHLGAIFVENESTPNIRWSFRMRGKGQRPLLFT